jgi:hypothetical protein
MTKRKKCENKIKTELLTKIKLRNYMNNFAESYSS